MNHGRVVNGVCTTCYRDAGLFFDCGPRTDNVFGQDVESRIKSVLQETAGTGAQNICDEMTRSFMVGPYDDAGIEHPDREKGPGFAIFVGTWRIGWWLTREEACCECEKLVRMIHEFPMRRGQ